MINEKKKNARGKYWSYDLVPMRMGNARHFGGNDEVCTHHDFWVTKGKVGTPIHLAFHADATSAVDAFYRAAIAAGGKDNGPPGMREEYGYAAFVLDPDGHNVEAVIWNEDLERAKSRGSARPKRRRARRSRG